MITRPLDLNLIYQLFRVQERDLLDEVRRINLGKRAHTSRPLGQERFRARIGDLLVCLGLYLSMKVADRLPDPNTLRDRMEPVPAPTR